MENRVLVLEKKSAFQEHVIQELNSVIIEQGKRLDVLEKRLNLMKDQLNQGDLVKRQEEETPPPHY